MSTLMVTDDGHPGVIVDTAGGGSVLNEITFFSIGAGVRVPNGKFATSVVNVVGPIGIYSWAPPTTFTLLNTFAGGNPNPGYELNINGTNFWGFFNITAVNASFYKFSDTGVVLTGPIGPVPASTNGKVFCVNAAETIAYWIDDIGNNIKRWDLGLNSAMTNLVTGFNANWTCDALYQVPSSTDVVAIMNNFTGAGDNSRIIVRYTAAGAVVYSITYLTIPAPSIDDFQDCTLGADGTYIWVRDAGSPAWDITIDCLYTKLSITDGSVLSSVMIPVTATPAPGSTCFLLELAASASFGGLYFVDPGHRRDSYYSGDVKIPNPTAKSALIGD